MKKRRKIDTVKKEFLKEILRLRKFDSENQKNFSSSKLSLKRKQLVLLTESIFFVAYREYENFIRDVFLLYVSGKFYFNRRKVASYLLPKDIFHAEKLIQSSMSKLDWNNPDTIILRSELYLKDGYPIKTPYTTTRTKLDEYRKLRNHIAHNSNVSLEAYKKLLINYYGTLPLKIPAPGEYLLLPDKINLSSYQLLIFFDTIESLAHSYS